MDFLREIAERKILEAMERGDFDSPSLKGSPLPLEDLSGVPEDLRLGYRILKNAGVLPPELELRRDIMTLREMINACLDGEKKQRLTSRLHEKILHYNVLMGK